MNSILARSAQGRARHIEFVWVMVMALATIVLPLNVSGQDRNVGSRISTADREVGELLHEGYDRSQTLRTLVHAIERSRWRVFIQRGRCPARELTSCLLHFTGMFEGDPYLRILITVAGRAPRPGHCVSGSRAPTRS